MAHLLRLIFALACFWAIGPVYAVIPPVPGGLEVSARPSSGVAARWVPVVQGCSTEEIAIQFSNMDYSSWRYVSPTTTSQVYCLGKRKSDGSIFGELFSLSAREGTGSCPANSTLSGSSCVCTSPYVENAAHTSCDPPPDPCKPLAGGDAGEWWRDVGVNDAGTGPKSRSFSVCDGYNPTAGGKCVATVSNATCTNSDSDGVSGFWRCSGHAFYTGTSGVGGKCDPTSAGKGTGETPENPMPATPPVPGTEPPKAPEKPTPGTAAPAPCPAGQAPGTVNGTSVCAPTGSDTGRAGGADRGTTDPDGARITEHDETTCNAGGSKCSTDTTRCKTAPGATTPTCTTTNSTDTATGLCAKSPGNSVCSGGGAGGAGGGMTGDCTKGFVAKGEDPIINAMAMEQYKRNCQMFETDSEERKGYEDDKAKAKAGTDLTEGMSDKYKRSVSVGPGDFDSSSAIAISQCIRDIQVSVHGLSISLPFSRICPYLEYMGTLLMAVSYLLAARILVRG